MALYGRKINNAEHQLAFIEMLRLITQQAISPEEAVRAYHGVLQAKGIKPSRPLEKDLELTDQSMNYDGAAARRSVSIQGNPLAHVAASGTTNVAVWATHANGSPDFEKMSPQQRRAYDQDRLKQRFG